MLTDLKCGKKYKRTFYLLIISSTSFNLDLKMKTKSLVLVFSAHLLFLFSSLLSASSRVISSMLAELVWAAVCWSSLAAVCWSPWPSPNATRTSACWDSAPDSSWFSSAMAFCKIISFLVTSLRSFFHDNHDRVMKGGGVDAVKWRWRWRCRRMSERSALHCRPWQAGVNARYCDTHTGRKKSARLRRRSGTALVLTVMVVETDVVVSEVSSSSSSSSSSASSTVPPPPPLLPPPLRLPRNALSTTGPSVCNTMPVICCTFCSII